MTDKKNLLTHNSLLEKWSKESASSLGLKLSSGLLTERSSLLSGSRGGSQKVGLSLSSGGTGLSLQGSTSLKSNLPLTSNLVRTTSASKPLTSLTKPFSSPSLRGEKDLIESGLLSLSLKPEKTGHTAKPVVGKHVGEGSYSAKSLTRKRGLVKQEKTEKKKRVESSEGIVSTVVIKRHTIQPPNYFIKCRQEEEYMDVDLPKFLPPDKDLRLKLKVGYSLTDVVGIKRGLINCVSGSLISQPNFKDRSDRTRKQITKNVMMVVDYDPEFILKVALYSRKELNIRTTSNYLLALASNISSCRQYLKKYFSAAIALPSDWIEVAEIYQTFANSGLKLGSLPAALRKAMISKFPEFDHYQLAKYNKESSGKKKKAKAKKMKEKEEKKKTVREMKKERRIAYRTYETDSSSDEDQDCKEAVPEDLSQQTSVTLDERESKEEVRKQRFTIKQLIRKLHIREPVEAIMSIIGKKYPSSLEDFYATKLPGTWNEEKAGKRMRLPVPETWETQVSLKGNKAQTWEDLIDHKKLPFMAMLRNLRNLIKAGISPKHHNIVIRRLCDQRSVVNSKQFPFRFFSAYVVLQELEDTYNQNQTDIIEAAENAANGTVSSPTRGGFGRRGNARYTPRGRGSFLGSRLGRGGRGARGGRGGKDTPWWILHKAKKEASEGVKEVSFDSALIQRYRKALDTAVKIATVHNVQPIKGRTILLCDIGEELERPCSSAKGLGKPRTLQEISLLMGLMCKYSCEECEMIAFSGHEASKIELEKGTILDNMDKVLSQDLGREVDMIECVPYSILLEKLRDRVQVDNLLVFGENFYPHTPKGTVMRSFLRNYRHMVNPNLLFVSVTFSAPKPGFTMHVKPEHDNDIYISGYSDSILRFIAERGDAGQVNHVDKIDEAYNLKPMPRVHPEQLDIMHVKPPADAGLQLTNPIPSWRTVRVFISSTFRDMHGERDLLTRFVFPELRSLFRKHFINVYEVDLRWGVTEEEAKSNKTLDLCLQEVSRCQLFVGLLGERYGWTPETYQVPDSADFDWVRQYPKGASVTELEMYLGALSRSNEVKDTAFFFLRDNSFEKDLPDEFDGVFKVDSEAHKAKMEILKNRIRSSGLDVFDNYPCHWGGCVDGKPILAGLEYFGAQMLHCLMNAVKKLCPEEDEVLTEEAHINNQHWSFIEKCSSEFVGRKPLIKQIVGKIVTTAFGVVGLVGKTGSGKTALMASVITEFLMNANGSESANVLVNMAGAAVGSSNLMATVRRLANHLNSKFGLGYTLPEDFKNLSVKFGDLLKEAGSMCSARLVIFLDGIDMMDNVYEPFSLEWLPNPIPENVVFVLTALEGDKTHKSLKRLGSAQIAVGSLDMWDKAEIVRKTLAVHRKSLDESGFGNQMKLLMLKKDAHNPLYLKLACEELRVFGVFEKVSDKLKSLPQTTAQILQEVLLRLEEEHGKELVCTALCLLTCARDGLYPEELYEILNWFNVLDGHPFLVTDLRNRNLELKELMAPVKFTFLARSIMSFLNPSSSWSPMLSLANSEIRTAVRLRYLKGVEKGKDTIFHKLLAGFYLRQADPDKNYTWNSQDTRAFAELPYHMTCAGDFHNLQEILCSHSFIQAKCSLGLAAKLMDDFTPIACSDRHFQREQQRFFSLMRVEEYKSFVSRNIEILVSYPSLEWQQAMNEPSRSLPYKEAAMMCLTEPNKSSYMEWTNKPQTESACYMTLANFKTPATCVSVSPNSLLFATGSQDALVRLYELATGKELRFFNGHSDTITDVCFVGNNMLCSASVDTSLSVWDVEDGHRIHSLKAHRRRVNSCASDPNGRLIASGGWDCTVFVWKSATGDKVCEFDVGCPVNCVDFHPSDELIVVGAWDSVIRIYNYFHKTRVAVLRGHSTSVRDVAYAGTGRHLASAALDGDVKIWAADKGSQVGNVKGHAGPINKLIFSPSGKELITAGEDHQVKVWSSDLGIPFHHLECDKLGAATSISISPHGLTVAVGFHLGQVRIHDTSSGVKLAEVKLCTCAVRAVAFSKDGAHILAGCDDNTVQVLESSQGSRVCSLVGHSKPVLCVAVARDYVATGGEDCTCCVYEEIRQLKSSKQSMPSAVLTHHDAPVTACTFNPKETLMATASRDASVAIYSMSSVMIGSEEAVQILHACHADWINCCRWSNSGDYLVTGSNDFNLKVWDVKSGKEKFLLSGHSSAVNSVGYKYGCIVSGCSDGTMKVWSHKGVEITTLHGHSLRVNSCDIFVQTKSDAKKSEEKNEWTAEKPSWADESAMETEGEQEVKEKTQETVNMQDVIVASAGDDGDVWLWKPLQAHSLACLSGHSDRVLSVGVDKASHVVSCSLDRSLRWWKPTLTEDMDKSQHEAPITFLAVSPNQSMAISGSRDGVVKIWKQNGHSTLTFKYSFQVHEKAVNCGGFQSNDKFVTGGDDNCIMGCEIVDRKDGFFVRKKKLMETTMPVACIVAQSTSLFYSTWKGDMYYLNGQGRQKEIDLNLVNIVRDEENRAEDWSTVLYMDQDKLIAGTTLASVRVWTVYPNGIPRFHHDVKYSSDGIDAEIDDEKRPPNWVHSVAQNGTCLFAGDSRGQIHVTDNDCSCDMKVHKGAITGVSVEGNTLVTASSDCSVKVWTVNIDDTIKLTQIGQFFCPSPITCLQTLTEQNRTSKQGLRLLVGDQLGNVHQLQWHPSHSDPFA